MFSHLSYGIQVWGSANASVLNPLIVLQKKAVRILANQQYFQIYGDPGPLPTTNPLFKNLNLLKLNDIFNLNIVKFVYETLCYESPENFWNWFKYCHEIHAYSTTSTTVIHCSNYFDTGTAISTYNLYVQKTKLVKYGGRLVKVLGPWQWNQLPEDIQASISVQTFNPS